ncbi:MAG: DNA polymerase IV [Gammaproteobacteria bacterium]|nr:DNA polymerase IV [Gammaproteobacteria bacterium]MDE2345735.1 DNA polymerase IV [Gammaproteobacteria bacterium]
MKPRLIAHVDMDAFYASVEQHDHPEYRGRAVIVGGTGKRSVVCAASYEARRFGVHSAMPMYAARRHCPDGIYLPVRMRRYREISSQVFECLQTFTTAIERLSLDEAFLDLSDAAQEPEALTIGRDIKQRIHACTGLTASVGLGPNMLVAKIASDRCKPDGLLHVPTQRVREMLDPLPVTSLWGIGPRSGAQLERHAIRSVRDLRLAPQPLIQALFGNQARLLQALASGHDERSVAESAAERSVSQETTFEEDLADPRMLLQALRPLTQGLCASLKRAELLPHTLVLKLRTADYRRHTRQQRFAPADNSLPVLWRLAENLLQGWLSENPGKPLRLIGIGARDFADSQQLPLFQDRFSRDRELDATAKSLRARFGEHALQRGMPRGLD